MAGFSISVDSSKFGSSGLLAGEEFRLQVLSIINPRTIGRYNQFEFLSTDSLGNSIDISVDNNYWNVKMTDTSQMTLVTAGIKDATNGAITDYTLTFTANTPVLDGDKLELRFPDEITLPSYSNFKCSGGSNVLSVTCTKSTYNLVLVTLRNVGSIVAGNSFKLTFRDL